MNRSSISYVNKKIKNSKPISDADYKAELMDLLRYFHEFCRENGLKYGMAYGSLLGAVRHKGFIPWDDDIDVYMPCEDYYKLLDLVEKLKDDYYVISSENSEYYYNNIARFCKKTCLLEMKNAVWIDNLGVFIDISPLHNVPLEQSERLQFYQDIREAKEDIMYSLPYRYYRSCKFRKRMRYILKLSKRIRCRYLTGTKVLKKRRDQLLTKYDGSDTGLYADLFDRPSDKLLYYPSEIAEYLEYPFEDIKVDVPIGFDAILKREYGDYMCLPPEERRITHHHFTAYWNDNFNN